MEKKKEKKKKRRRRREEEEPDRGRDEGNADVCILLL